jgi:cellulose synthase/poly-beta-1,6-N-acetylglucosamine synthase-like glycosyltransferase
MPVTDWIILIALLAGVHIAATWLAAIRRGVLARRKEQQPIPMPERWPIVSVIVPAWNEKGTLERCIRTLCAQDYPTWEAIIVAGGPDGTYQTAVKECSGSEHIRVLEQQPHGKNAAINQALPISRGEIIVLLDADSQVPAGWLRKIVAPINQVIRVTTGHPQPYRRTPISLNEQMEHIAAWRIHGRTTLQGSGGIAIHRPVIEEIGGFPEDFKVGVDWDLDVRLADRGIERAYCPQACLNTERPATLAEFWRNEIRWRRAHMASLFRHAAHFFNTPFAVLRNLYIYALAWFTALFTVLVCIIALTQNDDLRNLAISVWMVFITWLLLRRAALAVEVAVFTRDWNWLKLGWAAPLLLCATLAAIIPAMLTLKRSTAHFKGPRSKKQVHGTS